MEKDVGSHDAGGNDDTISSLKDKRDVLEVENNTLSKTLMLSDRLIHKNTQLNRSRAQDIAKRVRALTERGEEERALMSRLRGVDEKLTEGDLRVQELNRLSHITNEERVEKTAKINAEIDEVRDQYEKGFSGYLKERTDGIGSGILEQERMRDHLTEMERERDVISTENRALQDRVAGLMSEINTCSKCTDIDKLRGDMDKLESKMGELHERSMSLVPRFIENRPKIKELQSMIKEKEAENKLAITSLQAQCESQKDQLERTKETEIGRLEHTIEENVRECRSRLNEYGDMVAQKEKEHAQLESEKKAILQKIKEQNSEKMETIHRALSKCNMSLSNVGEQLDTISHLESLLHNNSIVIGELTGRIKELENDANHHRSEVQMRNDETMSVQRENDRLSSILRKLETDANDVKAQYKRCTEEAAVLNGRIANYASTIPMLRDESKDRGDLLNNLREELRMLGTRYAKMSGEFSVLSARHDSLEETKKAIAAEMYKKDVELQDAKSDLKRTTASLKDSNDRLRASVMERSTCARSMSECEKQRREYLESVKTFKNEVVELQSDVAMIQRERKNVVQAKDARTDERAGQY